MKKNIKKILPVTVVLIGVIIFCVLIITKTGDCEKSEYLYSEYISSSPNIETGNIKISTVKVQKDVDVEIVDIEYPYLNDNSDEIAREINTQIYKFVFFTWGGHYVLENDGYVTDIETRYGIPYVDDTLLSIFFETYGQEFGNYSEGCAGRNFSLESGKLLALSDFYEVAELKKLLEDGMKAGTVTIISDLPLNEDEKEEYFQTFLDDLGTYYETDDGLTGYMNYADNFFFTEDGICLIGEPYPSTVKAMFIEMKIDKIPTIKSDSSVWSVYDNCAQFEGDITYVNDEMFEVIKSIYEELFSHMQNEVNSEESADNETLRDAPRDMNYPYYYLDVDDPIAQELIGDGSGGFRSYLFIKGLIGYTPKSDISGMLESYTKDTEIIIRENQGLFQSERLAEVKEYILNIMMDIVRERGENTEEYQEYFAEEAMLQQMKDYLNSELEEDWLLLESFYLSYYAGNAEEIPWYSDSETVWENEENGVTHRMTETDSSYCFEFLFYADYKTMEYGEKDKAAALAINCALSKETGLIEEIAISKWYISREDFETSRW